MPASDGNGDISNIAINIPIDSSQEAAELREELRRHPPVVTKYLQGKAGQHWIRRHTEILPDSLRLGRGTR
ncbi:hypothetical protein SBRY_30441 [Actinacidiphila bryophytorum]|uniref:Uncharacterized protein n=1 Tax=Actinacidiphila bryophytorum TaxID=1436133 RepID=A0A9W4MGS2_9ACTN|nr:hypothetical protein SBRY_30441 [Actinacidiphila bryophytorum]